MNRKQKKRQEKMRRRNKAQQFGVAQPIIEDGPELSFTLEEARESPEKLQVWRAEVLRWIGQQNEELEALLLRYNPFDMLANLILTQMPLDPENYKEITHPGMAAVVEYAALLYLRHPFSVGEILAIDGPILTKIESKVQHILLMLNLFYVTERPLSQSVKEAHDSMQSQEGAYDFFRYRIITQGLIVRSPGYQHHQKETLFALFTPQKQWLEGNLGFVVDDLFIIETAIENAFNDKLQEQRVELKEQTRLLIKDFDTVRAGGKVEGADLEFIQKLLGLPRRKAHHRLEISAKMWFVSFLGTKCFSFTAEELETRTGLSQNRITAALKYFALDFGSAPPGEFRFSPTHELRTCPFLHYEGRYLYALPGFLVWSVQPRLEESLNPFSKNAINSDAAVWLAYDRNRAGYLEKESLRLLKHALPQADVHEKLFYSVEENGSIKRAELDGLIIYDTTLFLLEAKAGAFTAPARRGAKKSMASDLTDLFGKAHSQALRAQRYINAHDMPTFETERGEKIVIDKDRLRRTFLVTVTLESMDVFNTEVHRLRHTGIFEPGQVPWAVSLDVLRVICEMNEFPTQLVHYLLRRLRLNDFDKFHAHDELDWFGAYLSHGLYFENDQKIAEADYIQFGSFTTPFDDYYLHEGGMRKTPAPKPIQPMPPLFRKIILEFEGRGGSDHSEAVLQLLDWNSKTRRDFVTFFERIRNATRRDHHLHDFSFASHVGAGLTCFSTLWRDAEENLEKLEDYVKIRKYRQKADAWLGLLTVVDHTGLVHAFLASTSKWEFDEELEKFAASFPPLPSR